MREKHDHTLVEIIELEDVKGIPDQWTPSTLEYKAAEKLANEREYLKVLDRLHALVVARLMELHKMNMSQTGAW